jgi:hypothetical protein
MTRVHVEPVTPNSDDDGWQVTQRSTAGGLLSDLRRSGVRVALYNLHFLLFK